MIAMQMEVFVPVETAEMLSILGLTENVLDARKQSALHRL
jgi:hypothetical protein